MIWAHNFHIRHDHAPTLQADPQVRDCGAWTLSEAMPQLWVPDGEVHEIRISAASQPEGRLSPIDLVGVWLDERVDDDDVSVRETRNATVVRLRADRDADGDGRVYHIVFRDGDKEYTFRVGVPNVVNNRHHLTDGGRNFRDAAIGTGALDQPASRQCDTSAGPESH